MSRNSYIFAKKGNLLSRFTKFNWKQLGGQKNGWEQITEQQYLNFKDSLKNLQDIEDADPLGASMESEYRKLTEQAKGFVKDGKNKDAVEKFLLAQKLKPSAWIQGQINTLKKSIENDESFEEFKETADKAIKDGDFIFAIEVLESALEIRKDDEVIKLLEELKQKLDK